MMNKSNVILIGMPGSGKSTCGVVAAKMLLKNFYDTDLLIQNIEEMSLQQILDQKGEDYFSKKEEEAICSLDLKGTVIATGGSVIYSDRAMAHLKSLGKIIYLHLDFDQMAKRISNLETRGVLLKNGETLLDMFNGRLPLYEKWADVTVECSQSTAEQTAAKIAEAANRN